MKSNIRIRSWKRTISLAALLFIVFALTVLGWTLMSFSKLSFVSSPTSPVDGRITYSAASKTITLVGFSSAVPCTFLDVWKASDANGWGVVWNSRNNDSQYQMDCYLVIGDGSTTTWFNDTSKQCLITYNPSAWNNVIRVRGGATFTLGTLVTDADHTTKNGCEILFTAVNNCFWMTDSGGSTNLYSSTIKGLSSNANLYIKLRGRAYNCLFDSIGQLGDSESNTLYNCIVTNSAKGCASSGTISNIYAVLGVGTYNAPVAFAHSATATIRNVTGKGFNYDVWAISITVDNYLVDCIFDRSNWHILWDGGAANTKNIYRQYTFNLKVTASNEAALANANVTLTNGDGTQVSSLLTDSSGRIPTRTLNMGFYNQTGGNTIYSSNPYNLTITASGYQTYIQNFTLSQKTDWTIAMLPLTGSGMIEHVKLVPVDPDLTSPSGTYRWLDVADQAYGISYLNSYNYSQALVEVAYCKAGDKLRGILTARNLKPNFAYQLKLVGTPGTANNERIGLAGRWWQEEWTGSSWSNGQNLNNKGDGSSPNPNDQIYISRRYIEDRTSPTGYHYRYTGYLVFDYFITDSNGTATLQFETGSCYHVLWKTSQRNNVTNDGPVKNVTFDPDPSQPAYDTDYPNNTVSIFGEWERLPMSDVNLQPGQYNCQIILTEESFHGSGGSLAGNWAGTVSAYITFTTS